MHFALLAGALSLHLGCRDDVAWQRHGICEHLREARLTGKAARPTCTTSWL